MLEMKSSLKEKKIFDRRIERNLRCFRCLTFSGQNFLGRLILHRSGRVFPLTREKGQAEDETGHDRCDEASSATGKEGQVVVLGDSVQFG